MSITLTQEQVFALYNQDEMSKFRDETELRRFVESLDCEKQMILAGWLSNWRKNRVAELIGKHQASWQTQAVSTDRIIVNRINSKVDPLLERCGFRLHLIAKDQGIIDNPEFRPHSPISRSAFIAERLNGDFRLGDGNHRAILLAIGGCQELTLVLPD